MFLRVLVFAQESVVESLDRNFYDIVFGVDDNHYACKVVDPVVEIWLPVNIAIMLVEAKVVGLVIVVGILVFFVVDFFVTDCNDERHKVLVVRNGQGVLMHFFVCEVFAGKNIDH